MTVASGKTNFAPNQNANGILSANRFSEVVAQIDPSSLGIRRGGEERVTGVYGVIHDCRERRCQQSGKPKCEGYILGITLLELMLVIIIITAVVLTAGRYYVTARENARVAQAAEMITNVVTASFQWVEGQPNFLDLNDINILVEAGLLPQNYLKENVNPWQGAIHAVGSKTNVIIALTEVPVKACHNLKQKMSQYGKAKCPSGTNNFTLTITEN